MDEKEIVAETVTTYDRFAKEYSDKFEETFVLFKNDIRSKFLSLILGENKKILDVGCGSGNYVNFFNEHGFISRGIDISSGMVEICKNRGLDVELGDFRDFDFAHEMFGGVFCNASLIHLQKKEMDFALKKISDILVLDGLCFVSLKFGESEGIVEDRFGKRFFSFWNNEEFLSLAEKYFDLVSKYDLKIGRTHFLTFVFRKKR